MLEIKKAWEFQENQKITIRDKEYNVHAAILLAQEIETKELLICDMAISYRSPCQNNLRSFIEHVKLVEDADLKYPIILNEDGCIIDGKHRLVKAILNGDEKIATKRFINDPSACFEWT